MVKLSLFLENKNNFKNNYTYVHCTMYTFRYKIWKLRTPFSVQNNAVIVNVVKFYILGFKYVSKFPFFYCNQKCPSSWENCLVIGYLRVYTFDSGGLFWDILIRTCLWKHTCVCQQQYFKYYCRELWKMHCTLRLSVKLYNGIYMCSAHILCKYLSSLFFRKSI